MAANPAALKKSASTSTSPENESDNSRLEPCANCATPPSTRRTRRDHGGGLVRRTVRRRDRRRSRPLSRGPFVSYAQNQEDVVLARALRPDDRGGFWVDVGAGDPVVDSVTAAFAERGWRGVNVEPLPFEHERLCAARPADRNPLVPLGPTAGRGPLFRQPA